MKKDPKFYLRQLKLADKEEDEYRKRAKRTVETYRGEYKSDKAKSGPVRFNILWSNTQVQLPAMYSARPKPDVRRRHRSQDDVGRTVSTILERALEWSMDSGYDFDRMAEKLVLDYLLPGRIVARIRYHPFFQTKTRETRLENKPETELREGESIEEQDDGSFLFKTEFEDLVAEEVRAYHVPWNYYRQSPADCWNDVWWVAYGDNFLTKEEILEQFGEEFDDVPLNFTDEDKAEDGGEEEHVKRAQVWELWDKEEKQVVAVVKGYDKFLFKENDPLKLKDFFPQPEPAVLIESTDSLIPIPEYTMYQAQAEELNIVSERISRLAEAMKAKGFYPGSDKADLETLLKSDENMLIPVADWPAMIDKGGLDNMISWLPIQDMANVWVRLIQQRQEIIQSIFQLVGISDIQRGATDPRETKGAQQLKANFGSRRLLPKQQRFQRFIRNLLRLKAEVMAEQFSPRTLQAISATPVDENVITVMRSDVLRSFSVDIETDSTVAPDEERDKQGVAEYLSAMSQFLAQVFPLVQASPAAIQPVVSMLLWMSRKFKIARDVEQDIEDFAAAFQQGQQNESDDPEADKAKAEIQAMAEKTQAEIQLADAESAREQQRKDQETAAEIRRKDLEAKAKLRREEDKKTADIQKKLSEPKEERPDNVVPIRKNFRLVKENGKTIAAEIEENGRIRRIDFEFDDNGKVTGGSVA